MIYFYLFYNLFDYLCSVKLSKRLIDTLFGFKKIVFIRFVFQIV